MAKSTSNLRVLIGRAIGFVWTFLTKFLPFLSNLGQPTATTNPIIGAYYYPWYDTNRHWNEGYLRENLNPVQEPLLGHYSVRDATVINQHLQWANSYRVKHLVASWWGQGSFEDVTIRDYLLPACSEACNIGEVQIGLFYESSGILQREDSGIHFSEGGSNEQQLIDDFVYMAETYFNHPNYLRIDGKPVVYLYLTRIFKGSYRQVFDNARAHIRTNYGIEMDLVGDEVWWKDPNEERIGTFDAITAYNMHGPAEYDGYPGDTNFIWDMKMVYHIYQDVANNLQVDFIPGIIPAFNDRGVRLETDHYVIPHEVTDDLAGSGQYTTFWESLKMAFDVLRRRQDDSSPAIVMITSWNEFHEDTNIEPTKGFAGTAGEPFTYTQGYLFEDYGFKLLDLIPRFLDEVAAGSFSQEEDEVD